MQQAVRQTESDSQVLTRDDSLRLRYAATRGAFASVVNRFVISANAVGFF